MRLSSLAQPLGAFGAIMMATAVLAQEEGSGKPIPGGINFQEPVTQIARDLHWLHNSFIMPIITIICLLVVLLLGWVAFRYNARRNPTPARFTHNALLEVVWTVVPIIILVAIIPPSLKLLYDQEVPPQADVVVKATGNQWYWSYEYPEEELEFDANMLGSGELTANETVTEELAEYGYEPDEFLLATDTQIVVPVDQNILVQVIGADVIHAWAIPAFGVKVDAMPGRINQTWFRAEKTGRYFGQCSELCGKNHAYMPIVVDVVTAEEYEEWIEIAREEYASGPRQTTVAAAGPLTD